MMCPHCEIELVRQENDPDTNIVGGWYCEECDCFVHESEAEWEVE